MLAFVALTLMGAQVVQLGVFARTYALVHYAEHDRLLDRLRRRIHLEHGLLFGLALFLVGAGVLVAVFVRWAQAGFGPLADEYPTALGVTMIGLGVQTIFGSFFISLLTMRAKRADAGPEQSLAIVEQEVERV
jgi:hypothetical protein